MNRAIQSDLLDEEYPLAIESAYVRFRYHEKEKATEEQKESMRESPAAQLDDEVRSRVLPFPVQSTHIRTDAGNRYPSVLPTARGPNQSP